MNLQDWAKFVALYASKAPPINRLGISLPTWNALLKPSEENLKQPYVAGWIPAQRAWGNGQVLNHAGSNTSWYCVAWVAPEKEFFVLVACNAFNSEVPKACDEVAAMLLTTN